MHQVVENFKRFHPCPEVIMKSDPQEEPEFIKPYFGLRLFPVWHIGSDYLHEIGKAWYDYLLNKGINFEWEAEVVKIDFNRGILLWKNDRINHFTKTTREYYDELIFA